MPFKTVASHTSVVKLESGVSWGNLPIGILKTFSLSVATKPHHFTQAIPWVASSHPWPSRQWSSIAQWWVCPCGVWISMGTSSIWDPQNFSFQRYNLTSFLNVIKTFLLFRFPAWPIVLSQWLLRPALSLKENIWWKHFLWCGNCYSTRTNNWSHQQVGQC